VSVTKASEIPARKVFNIRDVIGTRQFAGVHAGPHADPIVLSLDAPPDGRAPTVSGYVQLRTEQVHRYRIDHLCGDVWETVDLAPTDEVYHAAQPLGRDEWLLVRARAEGDADRNAHVYGPDGAWRRSFPGGDGIEDVQVTPEGRIWVSYFDEGVFGKTALAQSGLVCLDGHGTPLLRYNQLLVGAAARIDDCYALNVCSDRETWLCYYHDFPLVRLANGEPAGLWTDIPVKGAVAFAVWRGRVLFTGDYERNCRLVLVDLETRRATEFLPVDEQGELIARFAAIGRGSRLWLWADETLHVIDLAGPTV